MKKNYNLGAWFYRAIQNTVCMHGLKLKISKILKFRYSNICFAVCLLYIPVNNFSVMSGHFPVLLG